MKRSHGLLALSALTAATVFAGCGDDTSNPATPPSGGSAGMTSGGSTSAMSNTAGMQSTGTAGGGAGGASGGTGGTAAGNGGTPAAGTAGTGGTPPVIVPTVFLIDNVRLQLKTEGAGGEGAGGEGGGSAGGEGGASEAALAVIGGASGAGGEGGSGPAGAAPDFLLTFDQNLGPLAIHGPGFSPGPGGSLGPSIMDTTTLVWQANEGKPGGAAKLSIPFTVAKQQADIGGTFATAADLGGYELLADVKLTGVGDIGECATAWMYVYGANGYANDKSGEPAENTTSHVKKDTWTTMRLDLDGPYGFHTMSGTFKPEDVAIWGIQVNTWGCP